MRTVGVEWSVRRLRTIRWTVIWIGWWSLIVWISVWWMRHRLSWSRIEVISCTRFMSMWRKGLFTWFSIWWCIIFGIMWTSRLRWGSVSMWWNISCWCFLILYVLVIFEEVTKYPLGRLLSTVCCLVLFIVVWNANSLWIFTKILCKYFWYWYFATSTYSKARKLGQD